MDNKMPSNPAHGQGAISNEISEMLLVNAPLRKGYEEYEESFPGYEIPEYHGPEDEYPEDGGEVEGTPGPAIHTLPSSDPLFLPESSFAERLGGLLGFEKNELDELLGGTDQDYGLSSNLASTDSLNFDPDFSSLFHNADGEFYASGEAPSTEQSPALAELFADASTSLDDSFLHLYFQGGIF